MTSSTPLQAGPPKRGCLVGFLPRLGCLLILALLAAGSVGWWGWRELHRPGPGQPEEAATFVIERGESAAQILRRLETAGRIRSALLARLWLRWAPEGGPLKAGEYELASGASMEAIVKELSTGSPLQYAVIVPEGLTSAMILSLLVEKDWKATGGAGSTYKLAGPIPALPEEGVLLPGDYAVSRGDTVEGVIARMKKAQEELAQMEVEGQAGAGHRRRR